MALRSEWSNLIGDNVRDGRDLLQLNEMLVDLLLDELVPVLRRLLLRLRFGRRLVRR